MSSCESFNIYWNVLVLSYVSPVNNTSFPIKSIPCKPQKEQNIYSLNLKRRI